VRLIRHWVTRNGFEKPSATSPINAFADARPFGVKLHIIGSALSIFEYGSPARLNAQEKLS
jgi:hypothetical protein